MAKFFGGGSKFFLRAIFWGGGPKSRVKKICPKIGPPVFLKIVSSQTNIMNAIFDQRSTRPPEGGVLRWHRQTNSHGVFTNLAQWGQVGENLYSKNNYSSLSLPVYKTKGCQATFLRQLLFLDIPTSQEVLQ